MIVRGPPCYTLSHPCSKTTRKKNTIASMKRYQEKKITIALSDFPTSIRTCSTCFVSTAHRYANDWPQFSRRVILSTSSLLSVFHKCYNCIIHGEQWPITETSRKSFSACIIYYILYYKPVRFSMSPSVRASIIKYISLFPNLTLTHRPR